MSLPTYTPNTPTYHDDGTSDSGWTLSNCSLAVECDGVKLTQTTHGQGIALRAINMPVDGEDWCLYVRAKARMTTGDQQIIQLRGSGSARAHIYLNTKCPTTGGTIAELGTVSIRHTSAANATKSAIAATGIDLENTGIDCVLSYSAKNGALRLDFRQSDGTWKFGAQCVGTFFGGDLAVQVLTSTSAGAWVQWNLLQLVAPDFQSIGDSLCKGATTFSPIPGNNQNDGDNTWQRWCSLGSAINTFIVNKGVGGNTSALVAGRIADDVIACGPKVVFLGACNNDNAAGLTYAQRNTNIQSSIDAITNSGAKCILINAVYCTSTHAMQPTARSYSEDYWNNEVPNLSGVDLAVDVMQAIQDSNGYQDPALTRADKIHLNNAGAQAYGEYIASA